MVFTTLTSVSSRTARGVPSALLQRGSPDSKRNLATTPMRHRTPEPQTKEDEIVYVHYLGEEPGLSQVPGPRAINQRATGTSVGTGYANGRPRRYGSWSYTKFTSESYYVSNTTSTASCPYPTDGFYSYRDARPAPTRVLTVNENELDDLLPCLSGPLGFDMEWKVIWGSSHVPKTALIQLCDKNMILLIQISSMNRFPAQLKTLLESPDIIKMGINISGDARKLQKDFNLKMRGILELLDVARCYDPDFSIPGRWISLSNIVAKYLGKTLNKGPVRVSNWEAVLNEEQMEYAASDAYCALQVYNRIRDIGGERNIDVDVMTLLDGRKQTRSTANAAVNIVASESIDRVANSKTLRPAPRVIATTTMEEKKGLTRQQTRAYTLWHEAKKPLDDICAELRSPENPLKRSTVIGHVVEALKADRTLDYDLDSLQALLSLDLPSYKRHERWYKLRKGFVDLELQMEMERMSVDG